MLLCDMLVIRGTTMTLKSEDYAWDQYTQKYET